MPGLGKKTFTAGDVLIAGDVNNYLMDQTVMNFATVAARSSAIPVPSTGMVSYVGDTGSETPSATIPQIQAYTGAAWQNMDGMTLLTRSTVSGSAGGMAIDNIFTSQFENYQILATYSGSQDSALQMRLRAGGTPAQGATDYLTQKSTAVGATLLTGLTTSSSWEVQGSRISTSMVEIKLFKPNVAASSFISYQEWDNSGIYAVGTGRHTPATAFDGFQFIVTGNFTATVRVYGFRN